ncbi:hypothetical protein GQ53DRAFT_85694 [Thozetella sp. PMI_491]|nr:hypothetical protein GQ53DRAFT_85694 [Thozetella sp. PMI_491]
MDGGRKLRLLAAPEALKAIKALQRGPRTPWADAQRGTPPPAAFSTRGGRGGGREVKKTFAREKFRGEIGVASFDPDPIPGVGSPDPTDHLAPDLPFLCPLPILPCPSPPCSLVIRLGQYQILGEDSQLLEGFEVTVVCSSSTIPGCDLPPPGISRQLPPKNHPVSHEQRSPVGLHAFDAEQMRIKPSVSKSKQSET